MKKVALLLLSVLALLIVACAPPDVPQEQIELPDGLLTITTTGEGTVLVSWSVSDPANGADIELDATPGAGYLFDHWSGDIDSTANPLSFNASGDINVTAVYVKAYTLTIDLNTALLSTASIEISPAPEMGLYKENTVITLNAPDFPTQFSFAEWQGDLSGTNALETITMNGDKAITAVYTDAAVTALEAIGSTLIAVRTAGQTNIGNDLVLPSNPAPGENITEYIQTINGPNGGTCEYILTVDESGTSIVITSEWLFSDYIDSQNNTINSSGYFTNIETVGNPTAGTITGNLSFSDTGGNSFILVYDYVYNKNAGDTPLLGIGLESGTCTINGVVYDHTYTAQP